MNINGKRTLNRKERRKAKAKPLARPGVPVHSGVAGITATDGSKQFYWFATEDYDRFLAIQTMGPMELMATQELHGPFDTADEADADAMIAINGEDCEIRHGGMWDRSGASRNEAAIAERLLLLGVLHPNAPAQTA